jgi:predicted HAD superfamily phosphohydrolase
MKLFPRGGRIFAVISRYDDLLTLEGCPLYEPGDTLALTIPFLFYDGIKDEQIAAMGQNAKLTAGVTELIVKLKSQGWHVFYISMSYE